VCVIIAENAGICYVHVHSKPLNILQSSQSEELLLHQNFSDSDLRSVHWINIWFTDL